jgi:hypothetical protein
MTTSKMDTEIIRGLVNKGYSAAEIASKMGMDVRDVLLVTADFSRPPVKPNKEGLTAEGHP